ncbi:hypothetical protein Tco_0145780 [Tanacetum coccineum]
MYGFPQIISDTVLVPSFHMPCLLFLVVATSEAGYVLGSSSTVDLAGLHYTCAGIMMVAASAITLNQGIQVSWHRGLEDKGINDLRSFKGVAAKKGNKFATGASSESTASDNTKKKWRGKPGGENMCWSS